MVLKRYKQPQLVYYFAFVLFSLLIQSFEARMFWVGPKDNETVVLNISNTLNDTAMRNLGFRTIPARDDYRPKTSDARFERSSSYPEDYQDYLKSYYPRQIGQLENVEREQGEIPREKGPIDQRQIRLGYKHGDILRALLKMAAKDVQKEQLIARSLSNTVSLVKGKNANALLIHKYLLQS